MNANKIFRKIPLPCAYPMWVPYLNPKGNRANSGLGSGKKLLSAMRTAAF